MDITHEQMEQWRGWSKTDDKLQNFVLSDIRQLIGTIDRLTAELKRHEDNQYRCTQCGFIIDATYQATIPPT